MEGFLNWFVYFIKEMIGALWAIIYAVYSGIVTVFNIPSHISSINTYSKTFTGLDWVFAVVSLIIVMLFFVLLVFLIVRGLYRYIRFGKVSDGKLDTFEEIAVLRRDVAKLTKEKERLISIQTGDVPVSDGTIADIFNGASEEAGFDIAAEAADSELTDGNAYGGNSEDAPLESTERFFRLTAVDKKYEFYVAPDYDNTCSLEQICDNIRNFSCSRLGLYYEKKTVRLLLAGMASSKLLILQGISGTGKTSLPYAVGKFLKNDATIASVQPGWKERNELFGYFNAFTKKFNETEVLRRIYESSYNDDLNIIILDEMNIARVEYYFAEMLSILEMPNPDEWKVELVSSVRDDDPVHLVDGMLKIPQNLWYVGTANNDDSTSVITDKVYDRAMVINLDSKGVEFNAPDTPPSQISYQHLSELFKRAEEQYPISKSIINAISDLDAYVIDHFRISFGNRIMKQLYVFVPVFVACGGTELEAVDYLLATKVIRKFEALNMTIVREEFDDLIDYLDTRFGKDAMSECISYIRRISKSI